MEIIFGIVRWVVIIALLGVVLFRIFRIIRPFETGLVERLGFLITGAAIFGWGVINSIFFILYAPRGPAPANIDGLNAFEIRIIPLTFLVGSGILFVMFLLALNRFEQEQLEKEDQDN